MPFMFGVKGIHNIKTNIENEEKKQKAILDGRETYLDEKLCERLVVNDIKVMKGTLWNDCKDGKAGDQVLKCVDSGEIVKNYTKEKRDKAETTSLDEAKKKGSTVYKLGTWKDNYMKTNMPGFRYKDLTTGDVYVIRVLNNVKFYMNIKTGMFVRETDGEIKRNNTPKAWHHDVSKYEKIRRRYNHEQRAHIKKYGKIDNYSYCCSCGGRDWYED